MTPLGLHGLIDNLKRIWDVIYRKQDEASGEEATNTMSKNTMTIKTGVKSLDDVLGGGVSRNGLSTVVGKSGTGKTILLLALAVRSRKNVVFYSPKLGFGELKARIAKLCIALDIDQKDVSYDINDSLWMTVKFPDHVVRIASEATRAMASRVNFLSSLTALIESGAVKLALVDSPCYIGEVPGSKMSQKEMAELMGAMSEVAERCVCPIIVTVLAPKSLDSPCYIGEVPGSKMSQKEMAELMGAMSEVAERCVCPIIVTVLAPKSLDTKVEKSVDDWLDDHVRQHSAHVVLVDGWPEIKGRNAMLSIAALDYDENEGKWSVNRGSIKMRHVFSNHSIHYSW